MIEVATAKHGSPMEKQGAILGLGLKAAGGQNLDVELVIDGIVQLKAVASMALFWTFGQWFPLLHFISFCFRPDCVIGLDKNLEMPQVQFQTNAPNSTFAYVEKMKQDNKKASGELKRAVLSKEKKEETKPDADKESKAEKDKMEIDKKE